jgi:RNA polymerase sigma-54 factor
MLKQSLSQKLLQKMSPQQIQYIKLLQLGTIDFLERVEQELLDNPALEKGLDSDPNANDVYDDIDKSDVDKTDSQSDSEFGESDDTWDKDIADYLTDSNESDYGNNDDYNDDNERKEIPIATNQSFYEYLSEQARNNIMNDHKLELALHLIGSLEEDGYLRRELKAIVMDLMFTANIQTTEEELLKVLLELQQMDPAGIGARDLKECLILQLERKLENNPSNFSIHIAIKILNEQMDAFTKKHYDKITKALKISEEDLKDSINEIIKLNPKPGHSSNDSATKDQYVSPDFTVINEDGELTVLLNSKNAPELRVSRSYKDTLKAYSTNNGDKKLKESAQYVKQKIEGAKWFIESIKQRQHTLLQTMRTIVELQNEFFQEGDETMLRPMIMKDVADIIGMDISTVSRVANSKYVETSFGIFPLKYFFSEGLSTSDGEEVSSREIKHILKTAIEAESKEKPLTDEKLMEILTEKGYQIARRTVAKYREQLNIPVARLRKEL